MRSNRNGTTDCGTAGLGPCWCRWDCVLHTAMLVRRVPLTPRRGEVRAAKRPPLGRYGVVRRPDRRRDDPSAAEWPKLREFDVE